MTRTEEFKKQVVTAVIAEAKKAFPNEELDMAIRATADTAAELVIQTANSHVRMNDDYFSAAHAQFLCVWGQHTSADDLKKKDCVNFIRWAAKEYVTLALAIREQTAA